MVTKTMDERLIPTVQYAAPTTGQTVTVNSTGSIRLIVDPSGTLATCTITMPSSPSDGDVIEIASSQIITALTMNGGTIISALTTLALGGFASHIYSSTGAKWFRLG